MVCVLLDNPRALLWTDQVSAVVLLTAKHPAETNHNQLLEPSR